MDNVLVIYKSIYGSTKKYAKWIAEDLNCNVVEVKKVKIKDLENYKTIIYGGGLYASGISGVSFIKKNYNKLKDKNIIVFTVGLSDTKMKENFESIKNRNFNEDMMKNITFFNLRGAIDYKGLSKIHSIMMEMLKRTITKKDAKDITDEEMLLLKTYGYKVDFIDRNTIAPIIELVKNSLE